MESRRIDQIDVLRGLAAMWVVLSHYNPHWKQFLGDALIIVPNPWGFHAVELFFVISGFVIFMTLEKCRTVTDFAMLRFSRLYPTYWAALILGVLIGVGAFGDLFWAHGFLANMTMLQEFLGYPNYDIVYWSLAVELAFYVNTAWLFATGAHRRIHTVLAVWLILSGTWALLLQDARAEQRDWLARLLALDFAPYFAIGVVYYDAARHGWSLRSAMLIAAALAVEALMSGWAGFGVATLIAVIVWLAVCGKLRFLANRATIGLGTISYALYLVHRNIGYHLLDWMHGKGVGPGFAIPVAIIVAICVATLLTFGVERPISRFLRSRYRNWSESRQRVTPDSVDARE